MSGKIKTAEITIMNKGEVNISATVVKYDYENFPDIKPLPIKPNSSESWERHDKRDYFCFLSESKVLYGFLCKGGVDYEYLGRGQMRVPDENRIYKLNYDVSHIKHSLRILAVLEDVEIQIFKQKDNLKNPLCTQLIKKDTDLIMNIPDGYYYLRIKNEEIVYGIIPGKCYYIAKGQVLVETQNNIIKKQHKDGDIDHELE